MPVVSLIFTILLCPLAAFALFGLSALLGKRFPRQDLISTAAILAALICSLLLFGQILDDPVLKQPGGIVDSMVIDWITIGDLEFKMGFLFDSVTGVMLIVVTLVSSLVHIFSMGYINFKLIVCSNFCYSSPNYISHFSKLILKLRNYYKFQR